MRSIEIPTKQSPRLIERLPRRSASRNTCTVRQCGVTNNGDYP